MTMTLFPLGKTSSISVQVFQGFRTLNISCTHKSCQGNLPNHILREKVRMNLHLRSPWNNWVWGLGAPNKGAQPKGHLPKGHQLKGHQDQRGTAKGALDQRGTVKGAPSKGAPSKGHHPKGQCQRGTT